MINGLLHFLFLPYIWLFRMIYFMSKVTIKMIFYAMKYLVLFLKMIKHKFEYTEAESQSEFTDNFTKDNSFLEQESKSIENIADLSQDNEIMMPEETYEANDKQTFTIVSANRYLNYFYDSIREKAPIEKEELKKLIDLTEYQFEYSLNVLLDNNAVYYHINKICINDNFNFKFQYEHSDEYDILNSIYDTDKYKQYQKIKTGIEFEYFLAERLKEHGYKTSMTPQSNDYGADIIAIKDNIKYVIQCKFYSKPLGMQAVQEVLGALNYYQSNIAIVATNSTYTRQATELAKKSNVILWDGTYILKNLIQE